MGLLDKVVRKPVYSKSNMSGLVKDYQKVYDEIKNWNNFNNDLSSELAGIMYGMGYSLDDAPFFGWTGDKLNEERRTFNAIEKAYTDMLFALEDALGIESEVYANRVDENGFYKSK